MSQGDERSAGPKGIDLLLMRAFYIEAILFMTGAIALGVYLYPTIMRLVDLSFKFEEIGDIGALVDDQVARVEGKLKGVTDIVEGRVDQLDGRLAGVTGRLDKQLDGIDKRVSGITSRLENQVTGVEKRLDGMFKGLEDRLRNILKFKIGESGDLPPRTAGAPSR